MGALDLAEPFGRIADLVVSFLVVPVAQEQEILRGAPFLIGLRRVIALAPRLGCMDVAQLRYVDTLQVEDRVITTWEGAFILGQNRQVSEGFFSDGESRHGVFEMPNVEGNRTTTLAAKPPPAVVGPCWPTSYPFPAVYCP